MKIGLELDSWLRELPTRRPLAVVLGGSVNALSYARSLGRRGVPVLLLDTSKRAATASRYVRALIVAEAADNPEIWLDVLGQIGRRLQVPGVVFPTTDGHVEFVARHASELSSWFRFIVPATEDVTAILDKAEQYERASVAGIRIPITWHPTTLTEVQEIACAMPFPCLLKPFSDVARETIRGKVLVASDAAELESLYRSHCSDPGGFVVQEIVPGADSELFGYLAFWDADGREHSWLTKRKVRQFPSRFGTGATQETVDAPELAELSRRLLAAFSYRGLVGIEWKRDERDGTFCLMEINARTVIGNQLAISAGVDFPWIAYQEITGTSMAKTSAVAASVTWVNEELEVLALAQLRRDGAITLAQWARSMLGARSWALWSWRDPKPFLMRSGALARGLYRALRTVPVRPAGTASAPPGVGLRTEGIPVGRRGREIDRPSIGDAAHDDLRGGVLAR